MQPFVPQVLPIADIGKFKAGDVLQVLRDGRGPHAQVLALAELVNLCEGRKAI